MVYVLEIYYYLLFYQFLRKEGSKCNTNKYRQIAISSISGKLFDVIILDAQYDSLSTDVLQFSFFKEFINCYLYYNSIRHN